MSNSIILDIVENGTVTQIRYGTALVELNESLTLGLDIIRAEAKVIEHSPTFPGQSECSQADLSMAETMPSRNGRCLDRQRWYATGKDGFLVGSILGKEKLLAGHRNNTRIDSCRGKLGGSLNAGFNFGSSTDEDEIRQGAILTTRHNVGSLQCLLNRRLLQTLDSATRAANDGGGGGGGKSGAVGSTGLITVGGAVDVYVGHRTETF
mmetsp:Transcript_35910/g.78678  ORF Transcript_35910/g.78678 Transcript_35910/m.78678 type:complete len:208 (-) Transcript_35910:1865-2488(-)